MNDSPKMQGMRKRLTQEVAKQGVQQQAVLQAIAHVKRHLFVESALAEKAYQNIALPIDDEQTISQPYTVARQTELMELPSRNPRVLEIGTGSGYQAAILAEMGVTVFSIERNERLHKKAKQILKDLNYKAYLKLGDGTKGWRQYAPYDGIVVTAGAPLVPESLKQQLEIGGKLVIPVGTRNTQSMMVITRTGETSWDTVQLQAFKFVPLIGEEGWAT